MFCFRRISEVRNDPCFILWYKDPIHLQEERLPPSVRALDELRNLGNGVQAVDMILVWRDENKNKVCSGLIQYENGSLFFEEEGGYRHSLSHPDLFMNRNETILGLSLQKYSTCDNYKIPVLSSTDVQFKNMEEVESLSDAWVGALVLCRAKITLFMIWNIVIDAPYIKNPYTFEFKEQSKRADESRELSTHFLAFFAPPKPKFLGLFLHKASDISVQSSMVLLGSSLPTLEGYYRVSLTGIKPDHEEPFHHVNVRFDDYGGCIQNEIWQGRIDFGRRDATIERIGIPDEKERGYLSLDMPTLLKSKHCKTSFVGYGDWGFTGCIENTEVFMVPNSVKDEDLFEPNLSRQAMNTSRKRITSKTNRVYSAVMLSSVDNKYKLIRDAPSFEEIFRVMKDDISSRILNNGMESESAGSSITFSRIKERMKILMFRGNPKRSPSLHPLPRSKVEQKKDTKTKSNRCVTNPCRAPRNQIANRRCNECDGNLHDMCNIAECNPNYDVTGKLVYACSSGCAEKSNQKQRGGNSGKVVEDASEISRTLRQQDSPILQRSSRRESSHIRSSANRKKVKGRGKKIRQTESRDQLSMESRDKSIFKPRGPSMAMKQSQNLELFSTEEKQSNVIQLYDEKLACRETDTDIHDERSKGERARQRMASIDQEKSILHGVAQQDEKIFDEDLDIIEKEVIAEKRTDVDHSQHTVKCKLRLKRKSAESSETPDVGSLEGGVEMEHTRGLQPLSASRANVWIPDGDWHKEHIKETEKCRRDEERFERKKDTEENESGFGSNQGVNVQIAAQLSANVNPPFIENEPGKNRSKTFQSLSTFFAAYDSCSDSDRGDEFDSSADDMDKRKKRRYNI